MSNVECRMSNVECGLKTPWTLSKVPSASTWLCPLVGGKRRKKGGSQIWEKTILWKRFSLNLLVMQVSSNLYSSKTEVYRTVNSVTKVKHLMRSNSEDPVLCSNFACKNAVVFNRQKLSPCGQDANPNAPSIKMRESPWEVRSQPPIKRRIGFPRSIEELAKGSQTN